MKWVLQSLRRTSVSIFLYFPCFSFTSPCEQECKRSKLNVWLVLPFVSREGPSSCQMWSDKVCSSELIFPSRTQTTLRRHERPALVRVRIHFQRVCFPLVLSFPFFSISLFPSISSFFLFFLFIHSLHSFFVLSPCFLLFPRCRADLILI